MDRSEVELMLRSALPIDDIDQVMMSPGQVITLVWVDIADRPDLASLADRQGKEGGYFIATWFYSDPGKRNMLIGLRVDMRTPVKTVFHLVFKVERYEKQLDAVASSGQLWIAPGPPPAHLTGTKVMSMQEIMALGSQGVALELEPDMVTELRNQLPGWKQRR